MDTGDFPHLSTGKFPLTAAAMMRDNGTMARAPEILAERIDQRLDELKMSASKASREATGGPDTIRDIRRRGVTPAADKLAALAEVLGTTTDWLLGKVDNPAQPESEIVLKELPRQWRGEQKPDLPVLATGYCDDLTVDGESGDAQVERVQLEIDTVIRYVTRPAMLTGVKEAYAIYFHGSSMEPVFEQGDIGVVDPRRPPSPGDYVVVQLNDGLSDDVMTVLVKRLVRATSTWVELEQFNPAMHFRLPRRQVARMHRILSRAEMLGAL